MKVNSHLESNFFDDLSCREIFFITNDYINKYNALPTKNIILHEISKKTNYSDKQIDEIYDTLEEVFEIDEKNHIDWLVDETESYCQRVSFQNALVKCMDMSEKKGGAVAALEVMKDALRIEFNSAAGIDYFDEDDMDRRFERYSDEGAYFPTGLETFDAILGGGLKQKTITILLGLTHAGKSVNMINIAANQLRLGTNVAYFTLEMAEDEISQRIDANLLNVEINDVKYMGKEKYKSELMKLKSGSFGDLKIKEYPMSCGSVADIEKQLDDWKLKDNFAPDVIIIDYINIMRSVRIKDDNMYRTVKAISEEVRGLATKREVAILTATQTNRQADGASDVGMNDTSESFGVPMSSDVYIALISTSALRKERIQVWKTLKNRNTGIVDYYFNMRTKFEYSKVYDGGRDGLQSDFLLENDPYVDARVERLKKKLNKNYRQKIDKPKNPKVKLRKKQKFRTDEELMNLKPDFKVKKSSKEKQEILDMLNG